MADGQQNRIIPIHFPTLVRAWDPYQRASVVDPSSEGPLWKDSINMQLRDGYLEGRPPLYRIDDENYTVSEEWMKAIPEATFTTFDGDSESQPRRQRVLKVFDWDHHYHEDPEVGRLVVTDHEIFLRQQSGSWVNVTPIEYFTAVCSGTNGSPTVSVSGGNLQTAGFCWGNAALMPDGKAYEIASIDSETQLTLESNYQGTTFGPSGTIAIRRYHNAIDNHVFAKYWNGSLYVGGHIGAVDSSSLNNVDSVIIRYQWVERELVTGLTADYVFCGKYDYDHYVAAGSACDYLGYWCHIKGFEFMPDGRVIAAGTCISDTDSYNARVWYSSHLDQKVWNLSPGGAFDVVSHSSSLTALGKIAGGFSAHFYDGISMMTPTGLDDPPLAEYAVDSDAGAVSPRALVNNGRVELYLSTSHQLHAFDGGSSEAISRVPRDIFGDVPMCDLVSWSSADYDAHRGQLHTLVPTKGSVTPGTGQLGTDWFTRWMVADYRTGNVWQYQISYPLYSIYTRPMHDNSAGLEWARDKGLGMVGCYTWDVGGDFDDGSAGIRIVTDRSLEIMPNKVDSTPYPYEYTSDNNVGFYVATDWMDFGYPGVNKYVDHIDIYHTQNVAPVSLFCCAENKNGQVIRRLTVPGGTEERYRTSLFYGQDSAESWKVYVGFGDLTPFDGAEYERGLRIVKMTIWIVLEGEDPYYA